MKFFLDTVNIDEIKKANDIGLIGGTSMIKNPFTDSGLKNFLSDWKKINKKE